MGPEDVKNLHPNIDFAVGSEGQATDVREEAMPEREALLERQLEQEAKPEWVRELEQRSGGPIKDGDGKELKWKPK